MSKIIKLQDVIYKILPLNDKNVSNNTVMKEMFYFAENFN